MGLEEKVEMYKTAPAKAGPAVYRNEPSLYERIKEKAKDFFYMPTIPHKIGLWYGLYSTSGFKPQFVQDKPLEELATMDGGDRVISLVGNGLGAVRWVLGDLPLYIADSAIWGVRAGWYGLKTATLGGAQLSKMLVDNIIGNDEGYAQAREILMDTLHRSNHHLGEFKYIPWHNSKEIVDYDQMAQIADPAGFFDIMNNATAAMYNGGVDLLERYQLHPGTLAFGGAVLLTTHLFKKHYLKNLALTGGEDE
jgi:hypothetical protein